jgi:hypothetical protein
MDIERSPESDASRQAASADWTLVTHIVRRRDRVSATRQAHRIVMERNVEERGEGVPN